MHSTNYTNTLILPSEDCIAVAKLPAKPDSVAGQQFEALSAPYTLTSDDLLVKITALRRDIPEDEHDALRDELFARGQACLRASPLVKSHGWAVHHDANAKVALIDPNSSEYNTLFADPNVKKTHGMRSKRA